MSSQTEFQQADVRPPSGDFFPTKDDRLAGTGTTEDATAAPLTDKEMATLLVGAAAIRVAFKGSAPGAGSVATTDRIFGAYSRYDWVVQAGTDDYVAAEAADGTSAYEAWVWTSSGPRQVSNTIAISGRSRGVSLSDALLQAGPLAGTSAGIAALTGAIEDAAA